MSNKYRAICREIGEEKSSIFAEKVLQLLTLKPEVSEEKWAELTLIAVEAINCLLKRNDIDSSSEFLIWKEDGDISEISELDVSERTNVYKHQLVSVQKSIELKLGTIHSVKGQTHTATLLLDSTNRGPIFGQLKPFFLGSKATSEATKQQKNWLNTLYVGLTRPTHLICVAIPESHKKTGTTSISWTAEEFETLKANGWKIARVKENLELDFI